MNQQLDGKHHWPAIQSTLIVVLAMSLLLPTSHASVIGTKRMTFEKVETAAEKRQKKQRRRSLREKKNYTRALPEKKEKRRKVEFKLVQPKKRTLPKSKYSSRKIAQVGSKAQINKGDTVIVNGQKVDPATLPLDKAKFARAEPEDITNENFPQIIESFDYPNVDIQELVKAISELTGKNFILDQNVRGKITIIAPTKVTVAEAYEAFLSALAMNGKTIVKMGAFLKIRDTRAAQRDNIEVYSGDYYPRSDQFITRIIHLKYISAQDLEKQLRIIPSKDGEWKPYPPTNSVIITDYGANVHRATKIIKQLDVPGFEETLDVIPVRHAAAKEIAEIIEQIITRGQPRSRRSRRSSRSSFSSNLPRFGKSGKSESFSVVIPDERTNSIIIVGNRAGIERIRSLVARLDFKLSAEEAGGVHVYYMKHGDAEKIAETLSGIAKEVEQQQNNRDRRSSRRRDDPPEPKVEPIFGGDVKIAADKATNSIIVTASKQDYEVVLALLSKLDIPRDQIYVKAIIMEMLSSAGDTFSLSYFKFDSGSNGIGRVGFGGASLTDVLNPATGGAVLGFGSGESFEISVPGADNVTVSSLTAFINFLTTNTESNILSTPQTVALNNEEAVIEVGQDVPVSVASSTGSNGQVTQNVQREKATIKLTVTPFISPDSEMVRMSVDQQVRDIANVNITASALADTSIALNERSIKTNVVVKNGNTIVLGGLIRDQVEDVVRKVPLLGDIPIIGWLFKSKTSNKVKNNLLVFITPKIMRNPESAEQILSKTLDERVDFIQENLGGRDPFGREMDEIRPSRAKNGSGTTKDVIDETLGEGY